MSGDVMPCPIAHLRVFSFVIPTCPPVNNESPKLMELVSCKSYLLSFDVCLYGFYVKLAGENKS